MTFVAHWEYDWFVCGSQREDYLVRSMLAEHGKDGWELVAVTADKFGTNFYFKRRIYSRMEAERKNPFPFCP